MSLETGHPPSQTDIAISMYKHRAATYEDSWHPHYSRRFIERTPLRPGDHVLSACCGTGLDAFLAAVAVGPEGRVVGVDISEPMLEVALKKQQSHPELGGRLNFIRHDAKDLQGLSEKPAAAAIVRPDSLDVIICSNAFVLFDDPAGVVRKWKEFLRPGGLFAIDVTHERNLIAGTIMERVAAQLGIPYSTNRSWLQSIDSFRTILEGEGCEVECIVDLDKVVGQRSILYDISQADEQFDNISNTPLSNFVPGQCFDQNTRKLFRDEWAKMAVDGKVEVVDSMYLYIARKPVQV